MCLPQPTITHKARLTCPNSLRQPAFDPRFRCRAVRQLLDLLNDQDEGEVDGRLGWTLPMVGQIGTIGMGDDQSERGESAVLVAGFGPRRRDVQWHAGDHSQQRDGAKHGIRFINRRNERDGTGLERALEIRVNIA